MLQYSASKKESDYCFANVGKVEPVKENEIAEVRWWKRCRNVSQWLLTFRVARFLSK
jgi:hypothetical protein